MHVLQVQYLRIGCEVCAWGVGVVVGQFVMAGFLSFKVKGWTRMVGTRILALVPAVAVAILFETSNGFDTLNQLLNILQSLMLPFALIPVRWPPTPLSLQKSHTYHPFAHSIPSEFAVKEHYRFLTAACELEPNFLLVKGPCFLFFRRSSRVLSEKHPN